MSRKRVSSAPLSAVSAHSQAPPRRPLGPQGRGGARGSAPEAGAAREGGVRPAPRARAPSSDPCEAPLTCRRPWLPARPQRVPSAQRRRRAEVRPTVLPSGTGPRVGAGVGSHLISTVLSPGQVLSPAFDCPVVALPLLPAFSISPFFFFFPSCATPDPSLCLCLLSFHLFLYLSLICLTFSCPFFYYRFPYPSLSLSSSVSVSLLPPSSSFPSSQQELNLEYIYIYLFIYHRLTF